MKLRFISSALAAALFAATGSYAAVVDGGTIHFEGELVNAACSVNTDSADQVVTLGQYRTDIFNAVGNTSALIPFTIQLNDCVHYFNSTNLNDLVAFIVCTNLVHTGGFGIENDLACNCSAHSGHLCQTCRFTVRFNYRKSTRDA